MKKNDEGIKVIFLGEIFVGKTSLIKISIGKKFNEKESPSLSANMFQRNLNLIKRHILLIYGIQQEMKNFIL